MLFLINIYMVQLIHTLKFYHTELVMFPAVNIRQQKFSMLPLFFGEKLNLNS